MLSFTIVIASLLFYCSNGAGFRYPPQMPEPIDAQTLTFMTTIQFIGKRETPIAIRLTSMSTQAFWNCIAVYHPTALDSVTKRRPLIVADEDTINRHGNTNTRSLCSIYVLLILDSYLMPEYKGSELQNILIHDTLHLDFDESLLEVNVDVQNCVGVDVCLQDVAQRNGFEPEIMASIIAYQLLNWLETDGWNQDGNIGTDGTQCTANCRKYGDTTGYTPDLHKANKWVPLVEDNGMGFFYHYDHVTPHIGSKATTKVIPRDELEKLSLDPPYYNYENEMDLVIDRMADLAVNDTQKMLVEFFDNKLNVAFTLLLQLDNILNWSWEERQLFLVGFTATEYDSIIMSWRAKVEHDLIRPTTLIKERRGNQLLTTYGGPGKGLQDIKGHDFEAYHRVMPHSEYPSGSGCLCKAIAEYADILLKEKYNILDSVPYFVPGSFLTKGSSVIEPGLTPAMDLESIQVPNLTEMYELCGESRLWGGMHFTASVQGSYDLCDGLGEYGYQYIQDLLDGAPLFPDDPNKF